MYLLDLSVQAYDRAFDTTMHTGVRPRIGRDVSHRCATAHWTRCSAQVCDRALDAMFRTGVRPRVGRDVPHRCATAHWTRCSAQVCDRALDAISAQACDRALDAMNRTCVRLHFGRDALHRCAFARRHQLYIIFYVCGDMLMLRTFSWVSCAYRLHRTLYMAVRRLSRAGDT